MKISQYADDSNFLLKKQESVKNVIKYFEKLQKAAGETKDEYMHDDRYPGVLPHKGKKLQCCSTNLNYKKWNTNYVKKIIFFALTHNPHIA